MSLTVLHLSDPHLDGGPERAARLRAVLDLLPDSRRPDAVLVTGDVADTGDTGAYAQFHEAMDGRGQWLAVPGNPDDPARFGTPPVGSLDLGALRLIGLDVTIPGEDNGELRPDIADRAAAEAAGAPVTVLAFHQPPIALGHGYIDQMGLREPEVLADLIDRIGTVAAVLCGHAHTAAAGTFAGVPVLLAPGIVSSLRTDPGHRPLTNREHPPGAALHRFDGAAVTTSFHYAC